MNLFRSSRTQPRMDTRPERLPDSRPWEKKNSARRFNWLAFVYYPALRRVREHLEQNLERPFSVVQAARIAGLNVNYFSSYFRRKVGSRFTDWQHFVRVERAKEWIRQADYPIAEVSHRVGFQDLRTFERAFKRWTTQTPSEYKRQVRPQAR